MDRTDLKASAIEFLTLAAAGRIDEAFERHVAPGFRHHNPFFRGDAAALREAMRAAAASHPDKTLEIHHALADGDQVAVFSRVRLAAAGRGVAVVHRMRFVDGRIVEIWDVGQPEPEDIANEHGMY